MTIVDGLLEGREDEIAVEGVVEPSSPATFDMIFLPASSCPGLAGVAMGDLSGELLKAHVGDHLRNAVALGTCPFDICTIGRPPTVGIDRPCGEDPVRMAAEWRHSSAVQRRLQSRSGWSGFMGDMSVWV